MNFDICQEVNEMWAGLGYYRRARFLLEVIVIHFSYLGHDRFDTHLNMSFCISLLYSNCKTMNF